MKTHSLKRRLIATTLLLEFIAAIALTALSIAVEEHTRMRAFDLALKAHADTLFGAVGDSDDPADDIVLDLHGMTIPGRDIFRVTATGGKVLGQSAGWPDGAIESRLDSEPADGIYNIHFSNHNYRFVVLHTVRIVDPGEHGGVRRPVAILYGASTAHVWHEVWESVSSYSIAALILLMATGGAMTLILRRSLAPLAELAEEASRIPQQQWNFYAPQTALSVSELIPLTGALESTLRRLQRSLDQQRRFTSDSAHELKTDLAIAKSSFQLLTLRPRPVEEYQQGLEVCLTDLLRLERTVHEMLTLARVEHGVQSPIDMPRGCDLVASVGSVLSSFESMATLRQVQMLVRTQKHPLPVPISQQDCHVLVANLLLNAIQHSHSGTTIQVLAHEHESCAVFSILDEGDGVAASALSHVFEPFFRGDVSRNRQTGGTGLGLAICKGICEASGGDIMLRNRTSGGVEVTVRLPIVSTAFSINQEDFSAV